MNTLDPAFGYYAPAPVLAIVGAILGLVLLGMGGYIALLNWRDSQRIRQIEAENRRRISRILNFKS